ncbi:MAG TPA: hypothetical protein DIW31_01685 [Bacteroidales bacterium]|nr:hypothetical protein [Bacteroidales bacterium]
MEFFHKIDKSFIGRFIDKRLKIIASTDPERIYVENVRSFYGVKTSVAKIFCEMATKDNLFRKNFAVNCPNDSCQRVIVTFNSKHDIPESIICEHCQLLEKDKFEFRKDELKVVEFYKLNTAVS